MAAVAANAGGWLARCWLAGRWVVEWVMVTRFGWVRPPSSGGVGVYRRTFLFFFGKSRQRLLPRIYATLRRDHALIIFDPALSHITHRVLHLPNLSRLIREIGVSRYS